MGSERDSNTGPLDLVLAVTDEAIVTWSRVLRSGKWASRSLLESSIPWMENICQDDMMRSV